MNYEFYFIQKSFLLLDLENLEDRVFSILAVIEKIREKENESVYKNSSIYEAVLGEKYKLYEILYAGAGAEINKDVRKVLIKIIDRVQTTELNDTEIVELISKHDNTIAYGIISFFVHPDIPSYFQITSLRHWYNFHRYMIEVISESAHDFVENCKEYFENIFFHPNVEHSLAKIDGGIKSFAGSIIHHLSVLNDEYPKFHIPSNRIKVLKTFSSAFNINVTPEGNIQHKKKLTFNFTNNDGQIEGVCCEPHMKLEYSNIKGDTRYYFNRIYFHEGKDNIEGGKILVAHIGNHI